MSEWCREIEKKSDNYGKTCRAKTTSDEHDMYFWGFSEYASQPAGLRLVR